MRCQLQIMSEAAERISLITRFKLWGWKQQHYIISTTRKIISDPMIVKRKMTEKLSRRNSGPSACFAANGKTSTRSEMLAPLGLKGGETVRVKSLKEIEGTLDGQGRCEGLGYLPVVMNKYCGGVYKVQKRINLFFDERGWRMLKLRNVVILDDVLCELAANIKEDWAGCDRTCFLFWKEAWLERVEPLEVKSSETTKRNG